MRNNHVREQRRQGRPTIGSFLGFGSPMVAEQMAHCGFDFIVIETEHNAIDMAQVQQMLMAMNGTNPQQMPDPAMDRLIERAIEVCRDSDVALGIGSTTPQEVLHWRDRGLTFLGYDPDYSLLGSAAQAGITAFRENGS